MLCFFFCLVYLSLESCVHNVVNFSVLSILDYPRVPLPRFFLTFICSYVEIIYKKKSLRSSSGTGWLLRNIRILNDNGSFPFYVDLFFLPLSPTRHLPDLAIWIIWRMSSKKQEPVTLHYHLGSSPVFFVVDPCYSSFLFSVLCCDFFLLFSFSFSCVLCAQWCQCLWIVHSWLPLRFSLTFIFLKFSFGILELSRQCGIIIFFISSHMPLCEKVLQWVPSWISDWNKKSHTL